MTSMPGPSRPMTITCANCRRRVEGDLARTRWVWTDDGADTVERPKEGGREVVLLCSDPCWQDMAAAHLTGLVFDPA